MATNRIGNINLDPGDDFDHKITPDGDISATYKGSKVDYDSYLGEMQDRAENANKRCASIGVFAGFGKGTLNKSYKRRKNKK